MGIWSAGALDYVRVQHGAGTPASPVRFGTLFSVHPARARALCERSPTRAAWIPLVHVMGHRSWHPERV